MSPELAAVILGVFGTLCVAMIKFVPRKNNPGHNPGHNALNSKYVRKDLCDEKHKNITDDLTEIKGDVKELLRR